MSINGKYKDPIEDGKRPVLIQDTISQPFHRRFMTEDKTDIVLTAPITKDDVIINVSTGHGFTGTGEWVLINYKNYFQQSEVISVSTDAITLDAPIGMDIPILGTEIKRGVTNLAVNGSATPVIFYCRIGQDADPVDIDIFHMFMTDNAEGDDSKYGGITGGLTNGVLVRYENEHDINYGLFKTNADMILHGAVQSYLQKAGGGTYSMDFRFNIRETYGVVVRLFKSQGFMKIIVRDDLTSLESHYVVVMGQITKGEQ